MNLNFSRAISISLATLAFILSIPSTAQAQFRFYGQNQHGFSPPPGNDHISPAYQDLGQNVFALKEIAEELVWSYQWVAQRHPSCAHTTALFDEMRTHSSLARELILAYRGDCPGKFSGIAREIHESVMTMQRLKQHAHVSKSISRLIRQSYPLAEFVQENSQTFHPKPLKIIPTSTKKIIQPFSGSSNPLSKLLSGI